MSNKVVEGLYYSQSDEWLKVEKDVATIGISDYAQDQLGDIVYIEEIKIGKSVQKGDVLTTVESVKAVSDVYTPIGGEIVEVNQSLMENPATINKDPYESGWIAKIKMSKPEEINDLMNAADYAQFRKE
ncbi:MAG: glycine cleavage system protein GcvH [Candidatus Atribacteria bacterium]|nr:glycine cleavage system protein GcvH [Candidatus Atribacteria bacterium]